MLYLVSEFFALGRYEIKKLTKYKAKEVIKEALKRNSLINALNLTDLYRIKKIFPDLQLPVANLDFIPWEAEEYLIFKVTDEVAMAKYHIIAEYLVMDPFVFLYAKKLNPIVGIAEALQYLKSEVPVALENYPFFSERDQEYLTKLLIELISLAKNITINKKEVGYGKKRAC